MSQDKIIHSDIALTKKCEELAQLSLNPFAKLKGEAKKEAIEKLVIEVSKANINDSPNATPAILSGIEFFQKNKDPHRALSLIAASIEASPEGSNQEVILIEKWHDLMAINHNRRDELYPHAATAFSSNKDRFKRAAAPNVVELSFYHGTTDERAAEIIVSLKDVHAFARQNGDVRLTGSAQQKLDILSMEFPEARLPAP